MVKGGAVKEIVFFQNFTTQKPDVSHFSVVSSFLVLVKGLVVQV